MRTYTYTSTHTVPMLKIYRGHVIENPRESGNCLGYLINFSIFHEDIDTNKKIEEAMRNNRKIASSFQDFTELIKREYEKKTGDKVMEIYPVRVYMRGCEIEKYELTEFNDLNTNIVAFYFVTQRTARAAEVKKEDFKKIIEQEIQEYNDYINQVEYSYTLRNENGEIIEARYKLNSLEEIRKCLPKEWENEDLEDYIEK